MSLSPQVIVGNLIVLGITVVVILSCFNGFSSHKARRQHTITDTLTRASHDTGRLIAKLYILTGASSAIRALTLFQHRSPRLGGGGALRC